MNQTDKDFIGHKLRRATDLINQNQPAQALREIADAVCVVAVRLESQTSGAHGMSLSLEPLTHTHYHHTGGSPSEPGTIDHAAVTRQIQEQSALASVKPLCPSGLLAVLSDGGSRPQCPACGLFHERRVVAVPLTLLGYQFIEAESTLRIGFQGLEKFRRGDRVVFSDTGKIGRGYVGDVTEIAVKKGIGREAITKVTTL